MIHRSDPLIKVVVRCVLFSSFYDASLLRLQKGRKVFQKCFPRKVDDASSCLLTYCVSLRHTPQCLILAPAYHPVYLAMFGQLPFDAAGLRYVWLDRALTYSLLVSLHDLKASFLIVHVEDDLNTPVWHAQMLVDPFLEV